MPDPRSAEGTHYDDGLGHEEADVCTQTHVEELDDQAKQMLSTFSTVRSKLQDLERAESDIKRFELSIEADRKRLQKQLEAAKLGLRNARIQMAVELQKVDGTGFTKAADVVKEANRA
jgi:hypothetical protein